MIIGGLIFVLFIALFLFAMFVIWTDMDSQELSIGWNALFIIIPVILAALFIYEVAHSI